METADYTNITQPGPFEGDRFAALFKKPFKKYVHPNTFYYVAFVLSVLLSNLLS